MEGESSFSSMAPPNFYGDNYQMWAVHMETYLEALDLWEAVEEDYEVSPLLANRTVAQIKSQKEKNTRKSKAKACLFAAVSPTIFTRVMSLKTAKVIWDYLKEEYAGDERIKGMQVLNLIREFELKKMKDSEKIKDYSNRLLSIAKYVSLRWDSKFPSSVHLPWNLHTIIVKNYSATPFPPAEIWNMPQLRHVNFQGLYLPYPPSRNVDWRDDIVLENLQTLKTINYFKCGGEVIKRIPNIKKLGIRYSNVEGSSGYCLKNLDRLHKLESFCCRCLNLCQEAESGIDFLRNLTFPHSLKKLTLDVRHVHWEDFLDKIGSLPLLEKLKLMFGSFRGRNWETVEGQFRSLKFLLIGCCGDLEYWTTESTHFPRLEQLLLYGLEELKEIPSGIGEILTLRSIVLRCCGDSAVIYGKKILEEQEEQLGEVGLQVRVIPRP